MGAYANAVLYHPNGSSATGIKHSTTQNERGLPLRSTYDGLDRLKTVTAPNMWGTATYGYDALDNLTSTTITGGISARNTLHNINATTNRLDSITNGPAGFNVSYGYDSRVNVTQRNSQVFEYDLADRLKRAVGRATYTYDGFKRRVSVVGTDGVTRVQVYAQDGKLLYVAPSGGTPTKYVYMRNHVLAEVSGSTVTYSHTDALGSPVAQTNASGAILSRTRYEPYGYIVAGTPKTIGFTGHVNDNDTGLVYMQQRYYDAFAGRFLSVGPVVTDANSGASFNRYAYANNSPYKYVDPDGRVPLIIPLAIIAYKAYSAYDTVQTVTESANVVTDSKASVTDRGIAAAMIAGAIIGGKGGSSAASAVTKIADKMLDGAAAGKSASNAATAANSVIHVTSSGVALPGGLKHTIPSNLVSNPHRTGSFGEVVSGKFQERIWIDPPTPAGQKGPNYSHYHLDGKGKHYSPAEGDKDLGFQ